MTIENMTIDKPASLKEIMEKISLSGEGIVFVTDSGFLVGSVTDGDIRRFLLSGGTLAESPSRVVNLDVKSLRPQSSPIDIHHAFSTSITHVPVLDENGKILRILRRGEKSVIPLCEPNIGDLESRFVNQALEGKWISSAGSFVKEFEFLFAQYVGTKHGVAVSNGTVGLVLALKILGIGPGDEVLIPNLTFGATANAVIQVGAMPVFVDVVEGSFAIDPNLVAQKITLKTKAIIPVHLYGNPAPLDELIAISKSRGLFIVEDAAEAIGTKHNGTHVGGIGDIGVFSFFANKTLTTGEGGMLVFNNDHFLPKAEMMRSHGFSKEHKYWHESWGSNFRLTNIQAAIGVGQMQRASELIEAKINNAKHYNLGLKPLFHNHLIEFNLETQSESSHWLYTIHLVEPSLTSKLQEFLTAEGIEVRRIFHPLNTQPAFFGSSQTQEPFPVSYKVFERGLCLPSSTTLTIEQMDFVIFKIHEFFDSHS
jgi:perosamine synthetase